MTREIYNCRNLFTVDNVNNFHELIIMYKGLVLSVKTGTDSLASAVVEEIIAPFVASTVLIWCNENPTWQGLFFSTGPRELISLLFRFLSIRIEYFSLLYILDHQLEAYCCY